MKSNAYVRRTPEEYVSQAKYWGFIPLGIYTQKREYLDHKCKRCGFILRAMPVEILDGRGCPSCAYRKRLYNRGVRKIGEFEGWSKPLKHLCSCGREFIATPSAVLGGKKCNHCSNPNRLILPEEYKERLRGRGIVPLEKYEGCSKKILHRCGNCWGEWTATPASVMYGSGCPLCSLNGFNKGKPGILYFLKIAHPVHGTLYKIGITNRSVKKRFRVVEQATFTVLDEVRFKDGGMCAASEKDWHKRLKKYRYEGPPVLKSGNTELFTSLGGVEYFF